MWSRQQINSLDVDYTLWEEKKSLLVEMSRLSQSCIFTVDVYKGRYDFASRNFADIFGFNPNHLYKIRQNGDLIEEYIHPDDRTRLIEMQLQHSRFIYSLPFENRNDYSQSFQFRMLNRKKQYVNVISRQRVIQQDRTGKAWIVMGAVDVSPEQALTSHVKWSVLNLKTGEVINPLQSPQKENLLTHREKQILHLIQKGLLSKEIAYRLGVSIHTIHNHRKNILAKLHANNAIEAIYLINEI